MSDLHTDASGGPQDSVPSGDSVTLIEGQKIEAAKKAKAA